METENKLLENAKKISNETNLNVEDCIRVAIKEFEDQEALKKEYEDMTLENYIKYLIIRYVCDFM